MLVVWTGDGGEGSEDHASHHVRHRLDVNEARLPFIRERRVYKLQVTITVTAERGLHTEHSASLTLVKIIFTHFNFLIFMKFITH